MPGTSSQSGRQDDRRVHLHGWKGGTWARHQRQNEDLLTMVIVNLLIVYDSIKDILRGDNNEFLVKISREVFKDPRAWAVYAAAKTG